MVQVRADGPQLPTGAGPCSSSPQAILSGISNGRAPAPFDQLPPFAAAVVVDVLDLHEGIDHPPRFEDPVRGCRRWPEHLRLKWSNGELTGLVRGRCCATNLCPYCRVQAVVETAEMLWLDAAEFAPSLWVVLTAREHLTRKDCRRHLERLLRACRRRWPLIQWFVQVEFQRRGALHLNLLVKGVPAESGELLLALLTERWCARVDAEPPGQHIEAMSSAQAVARYLQKELTHGLKREQAPPLGWRGHRTSQTRGYLVRPASVMREEARASLRLKREIWRVGQAAPELDAMTVVDIAAELVRRKAAYTWELVSTPRRELVPGQFEAGMANPPVAPCDEGP